MSAAPPLPARPTAPPDAADDVPDEPPPPYEPVASSGVEQTLEYGPLRPYQDAPGPPAHGGGYAGSSGNPPPPPPRHLSSQWTGQTYSSGPAVSLPPPTFPFWNGAGLTPAQTGYREPAVRPQFPMPTGPYASSPAPPLPPRAPASPPRASPPRSEASGYRPTEVASPGQPLLHEGKFLVYPVGKDTCWKCSNTGYKPFDPASGYRGDDPNHPCRNCWKKYGRPYTAAMRIGLENPTSPVPPNYQRPLRLLQTPADRPTAPNVIGTTSGIPYVPLDTNTIVVRPGDPRIGGILCRKCSGTGLMMGPFIFDETSCDRCNGAGRVFA
ncbi:hypothetical protein JCM8202_000677 [Rhodotorula sphaerocarpa]